MGSRFTGREKNVRQRVKSAKKERTNRAYYDIYFNGTDLKEMGIIQDENKTQLDRVLLDEDKNEMIQLFGLTQDGASQFELNLHIVSLYPKGGGPSTSSSSVANRESKWRLASVSLTLRLASGVQLSYEHEQLIDYDQKRQAADRHEHRNIYKVGSVSIETVFPFSLSRILFNGLMRVESDGPTGSASSVSQFRPIRLTISTHPTCDKFDYAYRFGSSYSADVICRSMRASQEQDVERLLALLLEDRFDQPLMFQGSLETLDGGGNNDDHEELPQLDESFVMWGAKVKKFLDARRELTSLGQRDEPRDCLFVFTECGHQIHLSRPERRPNLLYGMVHNSFDYASHLYEASLSKIETGVEKRLEFSELDLFQELTSSHIIRVRAFQKKEYKIEFQIEDPTSSFSRDRKHSRRPIKVRVNSFQGWALRLSLNLGQQIKRAQSKLLTMTLDDPLLGFKLAEERLLGGKGWSLVDLAQMVHRKQFAKVGTTIKSDNGSLNDTFIDVSVPRGLVVTSKAYELWLNSDPKILRAISELDGIRLMLAAKSIHLNSMSDAHMPMGQAQKILREQCQKTREELVCCQLPNVLRQRLALDLVAIFGENALKDDHHLVATGDSSQNSNQRLRAAAELAEEASNNKNNSAQQPQKLFAVRSSAVGEDSLETSAAGQMRTILNARGIDSICRAVVECWASQFELEAVTYKSQNGLQFNLPMAVVVQELVECQVAGVAATCDPMTGNRTRLEITANRGLGEGVVSGKQADTIRVTLTNLKWDARLEDYANQSVSLQSEKHDRLAVSRIEKLPAEGGECCLTDEQIVALANLLLEIRRTSELQDREVEWGITSLGPAGDSSSGSSSSSSSSDLSGGNHGPAKFQIHLLQSRPLTNLQRLSSREIGHELDWGLPCPLDLVSRANLGEVMPGALCALNSSYFMPITTGISDTKPFERRHSRKIYVASQFAFYAQMAIMIITYGDSIKRFTSFSAQDQIGDEDEVDGGESNNTNNSKKKNATQQTQEDTTARDVVYSMIGSTFTEPKDEEERRFRKRFLREKISPLLPEVNRSLPRMIALDLTMLPVIKLKLINQLKSTIIHEDLIPVDRLASDCIMNQQLYKQINILYERLRTRTQPLQAAWLNHILGTITNMAFNTLTLKLMCSQPAYVGNNMIATEILNDFSVLMRNPSGSNDKLGEQTESGDISKLLEKLLEYFAETNQLEHVRGMKPVELYKFLTDPTNAKLKSSKLFAEFMERNGHRAWKEFCLSTKTWGDDPSYIMRLLAIRLKAHTPEQTERERARKLAANSEHETQVAKVSAKLTRGRFFLMKYALPRARNATIRRESSKSLLIKAIHKYRLAFRHLAGLLCLAGLLPSADLICFLTIEELDEIVSKCCSLEESARRPRETIMPRLLYKARRRQQRCRLFDKVNFPIPTISVNEMIESIRDQTRQWDRPQTMPPAGNSGGNHSEPVEAGAGPEVRGITSCAGCVTGRACVISSLDDVDQLEPNDILVTYSIDISWSVYFFMLAGIVTEVGGIVSHGAVVAREYGLPTLCTAVGACTKFKTGQLITLDASRGVCYLAKDNGEGPSEQQAATS